MRTFPCFQVVVVGRQSRTGTIRYNFCTPVPTTKTIHTHTHTPPFPPHASMATLAESANGPWASSRHKQRRGALLARAETHNDWQHHQGITAEAEAVAGDAQDSLLYGSEVNRRGRDWGRARFRTGGMHGVRVVVTRHAAAAWIPPSPLTCQITLRGTTGGETVFDTLEFIEAGKGATWTLRPAGTHRGKAGHGCLAPAVTVVVASVAVTMTRCLVCAHASLSGLRGEIRLVRAHTDEPRAVMRFLAVPAADALLKTLQGAASLLSSASCEGDPQKAPDAAITAALDHCMETVECSAIVGIVAPSWLSKGEWDAAKEAVAVSSCTTRSAIPSRCMGSGLEALTVGILAGAAADARSLSLLRRLQSTGWTTRFRTAVTVCSRALQGLQRVRLERLAAMEAGRDFRQTAVTAVLCASIAAATNVLVEAREACGYSRGTPCRAETSTMSTPAEEPRPTPRRSARPPPPPPPPVRTPPCHTRACWPTGCACPMLLDPTTGAMTSVWFVHPMVSTDEACGLRDGLLACESAVYEYVPWNGAAACLNTLTGAVGPGGEGCPATDPRVALPVGWQLVARAVRGTGTACPASPVWVRAPGGAVGAGFLDSRVHYELPVGPDGRAAGFRRYALPACRDDVLLSHPVIPFPWMWVVPLETPGHVYLSDPGVRTAMCRMAKEDWFQTVWMDKVVMLACRLPSVGGVDAEEAHARAIASLPAAVYDVVPEPYPETSTVPFAVRHRGTGLIRSVPRMPYRLALEASRPESVGFFPVTPEGIPVTTLTMPEAEDWAARVFTRMHDPSRVNVAAQPCALGGGGRWLWSAQPAEIELVRPPQSEVVTVHLRAIPPILQPFAAVSDASGWVTQLLDERVRPVCSSTILYCAPGMCRVPYCTRPYLPGVTGPSLCDVHATVLG